MNIPCDPRPDVAALLDATRTTDSAEQATLVVDGLLEAGWSRPGDLSTIEAAVRQARVQGCVRATTAIQQLCLSEGTVDYLAVDQVESKQIREYQAGFRVEGADLSGTEALDALTLQAAVRALKAASDAVYMMAEARLGRADEFRRPDLAQNPAAQQRIAEAEMVKQLAPRIVDMFVALTHEYQAGIR